jgi:hypothetical protein
MLARISLSTSNLDGARLALIAGFRLGRDPVLPHAWSVFHCVATRSPRSRQVEPPAINAPTASVVYIQLAGGALLFSQPAPLNPR